MANDVTIKLGIVGQANVLAAFQALRAAIAPLAAALTVGAFTKVIKDAIDTADAMGKMAQKAGVAVETFSALAHPANLAGVSVESLKVGLKTLSSQMVEMGRGSESLDVELLRLSDRFRSMPEGANKISLALKNFGKSGQDFIPLLNAGSAAIRAQMEEAKSLGLVISSEFAGDSEQFNDNLTRLTASGKGLGLSIARDLLPQLNAIVDVLVKIAKHSEGFREFVTNRINEQLVGWETILRLLGGESMDDIASAKFAQAIAGQMQSMTTGAIKGMVGVDQASTTANIKEEIALQEQKIANTQIQLEKNRIINDDTRSRIDFERQTLQFMDEQLVTLDALNMKGILNHDLSNADADIHKVFNENLKKRLDIQKQLLDLQREEMEINLRMIDNDFTRTNADKFKMRKATLTGNAMGGTPGAADALAAMPPDPSSTLDQMGSSVTQLIDQFGTLQEQIGRTFSGAILTLVDGLTDSIYGLITGTATWGEVFQQVAASIIKSIIKMVVQWVISTALMAGLRAINAGKNAAEAGTAAAVWAPAAGLSSIGSYGGAAVAGLAALAVAMASVPGLIGLESGGFTGSGGRHEIAGVVHRGEYVIPADAVGRIGLPNLDSMAFGGRQGGGGSGNAKNNVTIATVNTREELRRFMESADGEKIIFDSMDRRRIDFGLDT